MRTAGPNHGLVEYEFVGAAVGCAAGGFNIRDLADLRIRENIRRAAGGFVWQRSGVMQCKDLFSEVAIFLVLPFVVAASGSPL